MKLHPAPPHRSLLHLHPYALCLVAVTLLGLATSSTAQEREKDQGREVADDQANPAQTVEIGLAIDDQGRVGIGNTIPTVLLTVGPDPLGTPNSSHLFQVAKAGDAFMTVEDGMATALLGVTAGVSFVGSLSNTDFTVRTNNAEKMRITADGKVGIGTTTPSFALNVDPQGPGGILIGNSRSGDGGFTSMAMSISAQSGGYAEIQAIKSSGTSFGDIALNSKGGNVGIGTTRPGATLHVIGSIRTDTLFIGRPFNANKKNMQWDNVTGEVGYDNSSRRYKENIQALEGDFYRILQVNPRTYTRPEAPDEWEIGYIAEEFEEAGLTALVGYDEEGLPDYIHYDRISLYLNEIVKEQQKRIAALEHENERLKADLEARYSLLQERLDALDGELALTARGEGLE